MSAFGVPWRSPKAQLTTWTQVCMMEISSATVITLNVGGHPVIGLGAEKRISKLDRFTVAALSRDDLCPSNATFLKTARVHLPSVRSAALRLLNRSCAEPFSDWRGRRGSHGRGLERQRCALTAL